MVPTEAPTVAPVKTVPLEADKHRLVASQLLAKAGGKCKFIDWSRRWQVYLDGEQTNKGIHIKNIATLAMLETNATNTAVTKTAPVKIVIIPCGTNSKARVHIQTPVRAKTQRRLPTKSKPRHQNLPPSRA